MPDQFYNLTFYEYRCILAGHIFRNAKAWEHTRMISYTLYCVNSTKKVKIDEYMPLITDPIKHVKVITQEDKQKLLQMSEDRLRMIGK